MKKSPKKIKIKKNSLKLNNSKSDCAFLKV